MNIILLKNMCFLSQSHIFIYFHKRCRAAK
jgi:hypothetical protein